MGGSFRFLALTSLLVAYVVHVESETCRDAGHDTHCDASRSYYKYNIAMECTELLRTIETSA